jgi:hypothetical protein
VSFQRVDARRQVAILGVEPADLGTEALLGCLDLVSELG